MILPENQPVTTLGKLKMLEKAHTQQYRVTLHSRINTGPDIIDSDIAQLHLVQEGPVTRHGSIRRLEQHTGAFPQFQSLRQVRGYRDIGRPGIQEELDRTAIDPACRNVMPLPVSLQNHFTHKGIGSGLWRCVRIPLSFERSAEEPGQHGKHQQPHGDPHAPANFLRRHKHLFFRQLETIIKFARHINQVCIQVTRHDPGKKDQIRNKETQVHCCQ